MTSPLSTRGRPMSFSEGALHIPRIPSNLYPLLHESRSNVSLALQATSESPPSMDSPPRPQNASVVSLFSLTVQPPQPAQTLSIQNPPLQPLQQQPEPEPQPQPEQEQAPTPSRCGTAWHKTQQWSLRFILHLVFISLFETIFFWQYVSTSEDTALIGLVNTYANGILSSCGNMTQTQRAFINDLFNAFINQTVINQQGTQAAATRTTYNTALLRTSWAYFGGLLALFGALTGTAACSKRRHEFNWTHIVGENLGLVTLLGLYEFMFFRTIVFQYDAVSVPELDRMIVGEFETQCGL